MKNSWLLLIVFLLLLSCKGKRTSLADDETVTNAEFVEFFPELRVPFTIADSTLQQKQSDSLLIGNKVLAQFIGDSILKKQFGKAVPKVYPIGRIGVKKAETYVLIRAVAPGKRVAYALAFDKENNFSAALPLLVQDADPQTSQSATIDSRYTIFINRQRRQADGNIEYRKDAYVYNTVGEYTLILTESNAEVELTGNVVNPLDTLARKHKYSGDYVRDKRNMVSVRDGKNEKTMRFFVHFEKDKGECRGEIKGEASFVKPNVAVYRESGDPCVLQFSFSAGAVVLQEVEGCGNYRDIKCFFEGSFPRKKKK